MKFTSRKQLTAKINHWQASQKQPKRLKQASGSQFTGSNACYICVDVGCAFQILGRGRNDQWVVQADQSKPVHSPFCTNMGSLSCHQANFCKISEILPYNLLPANRKGIAFKS